MSTLIDPAAAALFGRIRRNLLGVLYGHPHERFHLRAIARAAGTSAGTARRELAHLVGAGLLLREPEGRQVYYRANAQAPIFPELLSIISKTAGIGDHLRGALAPLARRIRVALVFGSVAAGKHRAGSDVDLLVIGEVTLSEVVRAMLPVQQRIAREVNPSVYSAVEWRQRVASGQRFARAVLEGPKLFLLGDANELEGLGRKSLDSPAPD